MPTLGLSSRPPDLQAALAVAGIAPSDAALYSTRKVSQAVEDAFGVLPLLSCHNGDLLELWLCIGLDLKVGVMWEGQLGLPCRVMWEGGAGCTFQTGALSQPAATIEHLRR
jgi:hypothetical protein